MRRIDGQYWGKDLVNSFKCSSVCKKHLMSKTYKEYPNCESIELCQVVEKYQNVF